MVEFRKQFPVRDYKERFEFKLTVDNNIICQRYFRINNFNPLSLKSYNLSEVISDCVDVIDNDLKEKTITYLGIYTPQYFDSMDEMERFFENPANRNRMSLGQGIVIKGHATDYAWTEKGVKPLDFKFDDGELHDSPEIVTATYKFAFLVDGKEVCSKIWDGYYPKYIRNSIDLSNKRGKQSDEDIFHLSFEQYLDYQIVKGKSDLVWGLIKEICVVCSFRNDNLYVVDDVFGDKTYYNVQSDADLFKLYGLTDDGMRKLNEAEA